jgi:chitodextrinase
MKTLPLPHPQMKAVVPILRPLGQALCLGLLALAFAVTSAGQTPPPIRLAVQHWQANDCPNYDNGGHYADVWIPAGWSYDSEIDWDALANWDGSYVEIIDPDGVYDGHAESYMHIYNWYRVDGHYDTQWFEDYLPDGLYGPSWAATEGVFNINDTSSAMVDQYRGTLLNVYQIGQTVAFRVWGYAPGGNCNSYQAILASPSGTILSSSTFNSGSYADFNFGPNMNGGYQILVTYLNATGTYPTRTAYYYIQVGPPYPQAITFPNPGSKSYGCPPFSLTATASSGLPITYYVTSGPAMVSGNTVAINGLGPVTILAAQAGNGTYAPAYAVYQTFTVLPETSPPTVPTNLQSTGAALNSFTLTWNPSTDNVGVTAYEVRSTSSLYGTVTNTTTSPIYTLNGLLAGATYAMTVRARDYCGNWSGWSTPLNVTTLFSTGFNCATLGAATVTLAWNTTGDSLSVAGYNIYRNGQLIGTTREAAYVDTGLSAGAPYTYSIRAFDAAGNLATTNTTLAITTTGDFTGDTNQNGIPDNIESLLFPASSNTRSIDTTNQLQLNLQRPNR